jgi:hypothetical protein
MTIELFVPQLVRLGAPTCILCKSAAYPDGKLMNGLNCTCAVEAMWLYRASQGRLNVGACHVRDLTNDCSGGTDLQQMKAVSVHYGFSGTLYQPVAFDTVASLVATGRYGAHLQISYRAFVGTPFDREATRFQGNHDIFGSTRGKTSGTTRIGDPLATGFADIPNSLLKTAAGLLDIGGGVTLNTEAGYGKCYAYLTPADPALWGTDVSAAIRAVDPGGTKVAAALRKAGQSFGYAINIADLVAAFKKIGHRYGTTVDPSDVQWLLTWATTH